MTWLAAILRGLSACIVLFGVLMLWLAWDASRLPYDNGRYFDGVEVHLEQAVEAYAAVAVAAFLIVAVLLWCIRRFVPR
jgi:hypothetical protein